MPIRWGCLRWGMLWGDPVKDLQSDALPNPPAQALISWEARDGKARVYAVYVNGEFYDTTRDTQMVVAPGQEGRFYFEVFALPESVELLAGEFAGCTDQTIRGDRIELTWTRLTGASWGSLVWGGSEWAASGGVDVGEFNIYWDEGTGGPLVLLEKVAAGTVFNPFTSQFEYTTGDLVDGTYEFRIDPIDFAGNVLTPSALTVTHVHDPPPFPATDFEVLAFAFGPEEFTASWAASPSSDVVSYRIYDNGGSGEIDYLTVIATIAAPATGGTWARVGAAGGDWVVAIRAVDASGEEENVDERFAFQLGGVPLAVLPQQPSIPVNIIITPTAGAKMRVIAEYTAEDEGALGIAINWYNNAGVTLDPIDFATIVETVTIPTHVFQEPNAFTMIVESAALIDGAFYKWAAKAITVGGRESDASVESELIRADGTPPADHATLTAATVI